MPSTPVIQILSYKNLCLILVKRICSKVENMNPPKNVGMKEGDGKVSRSSFTLNWQDKTDVLMYKAYGIHMDPVS